MAEHGRLDAGANAPSGVQQPAPIGVLGGAKRMRVFTLVLLVVLTAFTAAVFVWLGVRTESLVRQTALEQARSHADTIIAARAWNARLGGVYVAKSPTVLTNPYLRQLGIEPDDTLSDGTPVTLRNPAAMTREISEELDAAGAGVAFRLTSLRPVNPDNAPDALERTALKAFERGMSEYAWQGNSAEGAAVFRYVRPLLVDESCLECHGSSGYRVGDVRGALSITVPYASHAQALQSSYRGLFAIGLAVLVGLWLGLLGLIAWLQRGLREASRQLERMATVDALTGLWNRRYTMDRLEAELARMRRQQGSVGVIMVDVDHFKRINDSYGHAVGDEALRRIARVLEQSVRAYDVVGRIGGEELLVVAPDVDSAELQVMGERIRASVELMSLKDFCPDCTITVSAGGAMAHGDSSETSDSLVVRADDALYAAKHAGRNQVVMV